MKLKLMAAGAAAIALLAAGCNNGTPTSQTTTNNDVTIATPTPTLTPTPVTSVTVTLSPQSASGESGTATLTDNNGSTDVVIHLAGGIIKTPQPAHIHAGSCPTPGGVLYPLSDVVNGTSTTTVNTSLTQILSQLPLAINIHQSAALINVYTACGNIPAQ